MNQSSADVTPDAAGLVFVTKPANRRAYLSIEARRSAIAPEKNAPVRNQNEPVAVVFEKLKYAFGQAVGNPIALESAIAITHQPELVQNPQDSRPVLEQPQTAIVGDARRVAQVEHGEPCSVVTHQSVGGRNPQVSITGLKDGIARVLRQAVIGRPRIKIVFAGVVLGIRDWQKASR